MSELNSNGQEVFDQTPTFCPIKFDRPVPLHIRIRDQILLLNEEMRNQSEVDTPEEADDFEIDGEEWDSPYEVDFDHIQDKNVLDKKSDVSKEDTACGSSCGTSQSERSDASSSSDPVTASPSE